MPYKCQNFCDGQVLKAENLNCMEQCLAGLDASASIVCEATGEIIAVADASNRELAGLTLYGETTQSGTPSAPVPLESAGASGSIGVTVAGKNLIDFAKIIQGYELLNGKGALRENAAWYATDWIQVEPLTTYVLSGTSTNYRAEVNADYEGDVQAALRDNVFTTKADTKFVRFNSIHDGYTTPQLELGDTATPYEPYKPIQTLTASTPNGLNGVPMPDNVGDGFTYTYDYIDGDGKKRIADYVDEAKGVRVQRFKRYKVTQARDFYGVKNGFGQFSVMLPSDRKLGSYCLCTHYPVPIHYVGAEYTSPTKNGVIYKRISSAPGYLIVNHEGITTLEDYNAWLAENQPEFLYELAEPIETPMSAEELAAFASLYSNKPNTTVFNDANAGMRLSYVADTKTYIDNKIAELASAILNNA